MSASETSTSSKPIVRRIVTRTITPADDHVDPARLEPRIVAALLRRLGRQRPEHVLHRLPGQRGRGGSASRSYSARPELDRRDGGDGPREPDERLGVLDLRDLADDVDDVLAHDVHRLAQLFGRRRVRVQPRLGDAHAADVDRHRTFGLGRPDDELGRAAADVDDEVRRLARAVELAASRRGTRARPPPRPDSSSSSAPRISGGGTEEVVAVGRVARRARRGRADRVDAAELSR